MVVICEECGKVYKLDSEKLRKSMKGKTSKIKCKICDHVIEISLPDEEQEGHIQGNVQQIPIEKDTSEDSMEQEDEAEHDAEVNTKEVNAEVVNTEVNTIDTEKKEQDDPSTPDNIETKKIKSKKKKVQEKSGGLGLRTKMFFLFLVIPVALMTASSIFTQIQMLELAKNITHESTEVVKKLAEQSIVDKAKSIASQCSIFLKNNPDLNKDDFYFNFDLKGISIQQVGSKGFTSLVENPDTGENDEGFIIWCHSNPDFIGVPLLSAYKKSLGSSFNTFKGFVNNLRTGKSASGYYTWTDENNHTKEKFVAIEPIEQTPYIIISSTFIDDFTTPIKVLEKEARKLSEQTRNYTIIILIVILLIILLFITIYGYRLTNNIRKLTDAADRISVGELDVQIEIKSKDEIGALADAISRMQDSLRFSIERLRRRR